MRRMMFTLAASLFLMTSLFTGKTALAVTDDPHGMFDNKAAAAARGGWGDGTQANSNAFFALIFIF